tara:strand:+ start:2574 stop:3107 length:534 start_codon:yes stop_codon:yes gene_type:complete
MSAMLFYHPLNAVEVIEHLQGNTPESTNADNAGIEVRMLRWAEAAEHEQVLTAYNDYLESQNARDFLEALRELSIKGYLLTSESTGYIIYHAWRQESQNGEQQVLLVTPGLKTKNPLMWKQVNQSNSDFTVVELHRNNDGWQLKTSLDTEIGVDDENRLRLTNYDAGKVFVELRDAM